MSQSNRDHEVDALSDSERRYSTLFEEMRDALYISTVNGSFVDVNQAAVEMLGYESKEELLQVDIDRHFYARAGERERVRAEIAKRGYAKDMEVHLKRKDGRVLIALETCRERRSPDGKLIGYEGIFRDVTAQRRRERIQQATYRISEAVHATPDFKQLLHSIHHIINDLMPAHNFFIALYDKAAGVFSLPYFVDQHGNQPPPRKLWKGMTGYVFRTGQPLLATADTVRSLIEQGKIERISTPSVCWLGVPLKSRDTTIGVLAVQSYVPTVTYDQQDQEMLEFVSTQVAMAIERKQAEEELRTTAQSFRELFDSATDAIYIQDEEGRFVDVNQGAVNMYGYPREFFVGKTPEVLAAPGKNNLDEVQNRVRRAFQGEPQQFEFWGQRKNGEVFPKDVRLTRSTFFGQPVVIAFARDITHQKQREQGIARLNEVLKLTNTILRHDILNDLNIIRGSLELYAESNEHSLLDNAFIRIDKSMELIRHMRELESLVSASGTLQPYSVRKVVEESMAGYNVSFTLQGEGTVWADDALPPVIDNIVRNAVLHGKTERIDITITEDEEGTELRIADYGRGIPDHIKERVFEECFSYGEEAGTGLGLYIVKKTVERYGGSVAIEDNQPQGAVFVLRLKSATDAG